MMNNNNNENDVDVTVYKLRIKKFLIKLAQRIRTSVTTVDAAKLGLVFFSFTDSPLIHLLSDWDL
jgi:hypothetical protein